MRHFSAGTPTSTITVPLSCLHRRNAWFEKSNSRSSLQVKNACPCNLDDVAQAKRRDRSANGAQQDSGVKSLRCHPHSAMCRLPLSATASTSRSMAAMRRARASSTATIEEILRTAEITVVWSLFPNALPMSG